MFENSRLYRSFLVATLAVGIVAYAGSRPSQAATVPIAFDFSTDTPSTVATIVGSAGGLISFSLDVGDPTLNNVFGNFSMDIVGPGNVELGSVSLLGGPVFGDGALQDLGNAALSPASGLSNVSVWTYLVGPSDLPLSLVVTSQLDTLGDPFTPVLTLDLGGDLALQTSTSTTPLPGALVLFTTGFGLLGVVVRRRKQGGRLQSASAAAN